MTVVQAQPVRFGELLGTASRLSGAAFERALADGGMPFEQWVTLTVLSREGGVAPKAEIAGNVAGRMNRPVEELIDVINAMIAAGTLATTTVNDQALIEFSPAGAEIFTRIAAHVDQIGDLALSTSSPADVETARRVLGQYAEQLAKL